LPLDIANSIAGGRWGKLGEESLKPNCNSKKGFGNECKSRKRKKAASLRYERLCIRNLMRT